MARFLNTPLYGFFKGNAKGKYAGKQSNSQRKLFANLYICYP